MIASVRAPAGHEVVGVDCFTDFYSRELKLDNLRELWDEPGFELLELDLSCDDLNRGPRGGLPPLLINIRATQRLLEEAVAHPPVSFTYASSSLAFERYLWLLLALMRAATAIARREAHASVGQPRDPLAGLPAD